MSAKSVLHPQNILLADPIGEDPELPFRPVIIDFGASKQVKNDQHALTTIESTKSFMAPEMLAYNKSNDRADIYSLGCILYYMILGKVPGQNANGLKDSRGSLSRPVYRIIDKCNADYDTRYRSIKELRRDILRVMKHGTSTAYRVISAIPGFRTHNIWKMIIVVYIYAALVIGTIASIVYKTYDELVYIGLMWVAFFFVTDAFNLQRFFPRYSIWRRRKPWRSILMKFIAIIFLLLLLLIWSLIDYAIRH